MSVNVITPNGQWALDRLIARYWEFQSSVTNQPYGQGRSSRHYTSGWTIHHGNALVDLVSIAEAFSTSRLTLIRSIEERDLMTWRSRQAAWNKSVNLPLESFPDWIPLMGFVEARNALQHGLGRLTDHQLGRHKEENLQRLDSAGIRRNGADIIISKNNVSRAMEVCRMFISWLDVTAPLD